MQRNSGSRRLCGLPLSYIERSERITENNRGSHNVILSPRDSAIPCVLLRILTWPCIVPVLSTFSMLKFANASSPNTLLAYRLADRKSHSPDSAASGVRHAILVDFMIWAKYCRKSLAKALVRKVGADTEGNIRDIGRYVDTVFPFELSPHTTELEGPVKCHFI